MFSSSRRARLTLPTAAVVIAAALTGCGSNKPSANASDNTAAQQALGAANKATGSTVTIGMISDGKSAHVDQTNEIKGAQTAISYANDYLGGINGHHIELKVCSTLGNPAQATDCANQMVTAKVSGVIAGTLAEADQVIAVLAPAKIPIFFSQAASKNGLTTPGVFSMTNAVSYFGTPAQYAKQKGYKQATMVVIDVPGASGPARQIGNMAFTNAGTAYDVVAIPPGTADMTPQIQAAEDKKPQIYNLLGDATFCASAIKAFKTLGVKATITAAETCINSAASTSIPGGYEGIKVITTLQYNPDDPDFKVFKAALDKYADGLKPASIPGIGYSVGLALVRALNAAKVTDLTAAGLTAAVKSAPATPYPLAGGATFQCDGKALSLSPNVCMSTGILADAAKDGSLSNYQVVSGSDVYKLPGS